MKISDLITMCVQNLLRRKVRTLLTVVGVVVGTCAIVVMISIGVRHAGQYRCHACQYG